MRYTDIESEVAATTEALYQSLFQSTFAEKASITHWLSYWWSLLLKVYQRFDDEILTADIRPGRGAKTELINKFVSEQQQHFSSADVSKSFPTISSDMIRTALRSLRDQGVIEAQGHGRGAVWRKR